MKLLLILSFILPIYYGLIQEPKLCINCKHFLPDKTNTVFGRCSLFPKKDGKINYLVNGVMTEEYYYCSTMRTSTCGEKGKYYKKRVIDVTHK